MDSLMSTDIRGQVKLIISILGTRIEKLPQGYYSIDPTLYYYYYYKHQQKLFLNFLKLFLNILLIYYSVIYCGNYSNL